MVTFGKLLVHVRTLFFFSSSILSLPPLSPLDLTPPCVRSKRLRVLPAHTGDF